VKGYYLDQACDADESPASEFPPSMACDVAFFGTHFPDRARMLKRLGRDRKVRIYADRPRSWRLLGWRAEPAAYGTRLAQAVIGAKIVYGESARSDIHGYWSDRVYRILGHRGFFLTRYIPGLEEIFTNHVHLVWGRDDDEMADLATRYLSDEPARRRIAEAGFAHVRAHHTYDHRARELLGVLERTRGKS
jgi:spore maturation protein CgeB